MERGPVIGIWYYVFDGDGWRLEIFRPDEYVGDSLDHPTMWKKYVVPILRKQFRLPATAVARLKEQPYGMPRGRLDKTEADFLKAGEKPGDWVF